MLWSTMLDLREMLESCTVLMIDFEEAMCSNTYCFIFASSMAFIFCGVFWFLLLSSLLTNDLMDSIRLIFLR